MLLPNNPGKLPRLGVKTNPGQVFNLLTIPDRSYIRDKIFGRCAVAQAPSVHREHMTS